MPIFNFDGTEPIGKVHLNTGTSVDQIGSVYYFNGAEYWPIFSSAQPLYQDGNLFTEIGGAWTSSGYTYKAGAYNYNYTIYPPTFNADNIELVQSSGLRMSIAGKESAISLNGWSTLTANVRVKCTAEASGRDGRWGGVYVSTAKNDTAAVAAEYLGTLTTTVVAKTFTLDVSSLNDSYYIFAAGGNGATVYVDSIILT